jgi:hypothetical protein
MTLEDFVAQSNKNIFLREFTFSLNNFIPPQKSEIEFSDNVVWLDDLLITIQLKERNQSGEHTVEGEIKWFNGTILKKGVKQVKDTLSYLNTYQNIEITNERGHKFNVAGALISDHFNVISYLPHELLPDKYRNKKFYSSATAGFIHLLPSYNYLKICQTLLTPGEIAEYLKFREDVCSRYVTMVNNLPEEALIGQFLYGDLQSQPQERFTEYFSKLDRNTEAFDLANIVHNFEERISFVVNDEETIKYYEILKEIAKLKRTELKEFKIRLILAAKSSKKGDYYTQPFRFSSPRIGCGFVFIVVPPEHSQRTVEALQHFTYAHKYDQKLQKCVGVSVFRDEKFFDIGWCYISGEWKHDRVMEEELKNNFPFREVKTEQLFIYKFLN